MKKIKNRYVVSADLLSVEEAYEIPRLILANGDYWWLRSPGCNCINAAIVTCNGIVYDYGDPVYYHDLGVRPALTVINLPNLKIGETVEVFGLMTQYIGNSKVLLCESILESRFDEKSNKYKTSEVKQKIDKWFNNMREKREDGFD